MSALRLPASDLQGTKAEVVSNGPYRAQEVSAGSCPPPCPVLQLFDLVVANASIHDRNAPICSIFCLDGTRFAQFGTIRSVAEFLGVGWDLVKNIHKERLRFLYRKIPLHKVKVIGIDEFSIKEGHHYMTVVTDLDTGRVLHAVEGKGKEDIRPFLESLAREEGKSSKPWRWT